MMSIINSPRSTLYVLHVVALVDIDFHTLDRTKERISLG